MCGRFTLTASGQEVALAFGLEDEPEIEVRYNIAPSQEVAAVEGPTRGKRCLFRPRWGVVRAGGPGTKPGIVINARSESVATKPTFRSAFDARRCLVPADGFYEWQAVPGERRRRPFHARKAAGGLFALAGLWEPRPDGSRTCTLLTTEPNREIAEIHDRMPVILAPEDYDAWLDPRTPRPTVLPLMRPLPNGSLVLRPVSDLVNNARAEGPACLSPPTGPSQLGLLDFGTPKPLR
jgi:putative SOS response-associated peptidase YedK